VCFVIELGIHSSCTNLTTFRTRQW
jgi:hypothetical protein